MIEWHLWCELTSSCIADSKPGRCHSLLETEADVIVRQSQAYAKELGLVIHCSRRNVLTGSRIDEYGESVAAMERRGRRVAIVGAGMAGLTAAAKLSRSSQCEVLVFEAMDRAGGRILTIKDFASHVIELGANWIHGTTDNPIFDLAKKHHLLSVSNIFFSSSSCNDLSAYDECVAWYHLPDDEDCTFFVDEHGNRIDVRLASNSRKIFGEVQELIVRADRNELDYSQNFGEFMRTGYAEELKQQGVTSDDELRQYWLLYENWCRLECVDIGCEDLQMVHLRSYRNYQVLGGRYLTNLGDEGYQGILDRLLADIPTGSIHYETPVAQICYGECAGEESVLVKTEAGESFLCDHVIVTSSIGFLQQNIHTFFEPPLPRSKEAALRAFNHVTVNKIFLRFSKPFWSSKDFLIDLLWKPVSEGEELDDEMEKNKFYRMLSEFVADTRNEDVLMGWVCGRGAEYAETLTEGELKQSCAALLRQFLDDPNIPEPKSAICSRWHGNRYQRGSYSAFLPMTATGSEYEIMNSPVFCGKTGGGHKVPTILFAGEAYHEGFKSTVHGAMTSGLDRAMDLIHYWSQEDSEVKCALDQGGTTGGGLTSSPRKMKPPSA
ncbi:peroxisomal N(1)-acetyl-spermine/spermidine oxidase-like [Diadema antillarum]|uniref:peroxisomal N(1)-acetyl-spermine/spermidine oxidase-like n=1 Tax=Diadema antillarum TaxID=105358 RepID=UPI003A876BCE